LNPETNNLKGKAPPSVDNLADETVVFLVAASETTGNGMEVTMFHILKNNVIYNTLKKELRDAFPDGTPITLKALESLPYLVRFIYFFYWSTWLTLKDCMY